MYSSYSVFVHNNVKNTFLLVLIIVFLFPLRCVTNEDVLLTILSINL